ALMMLKMILKNMKLFLLLLRLSQPAMMKNQSNMNLAYLLKEIIKNLQAEINALEMPYSLRDYDSLINNKVFKNSYLALLTECKGVTAELIGRAQRFINALQERDSSKPQPQQQPVLSPDEPLLLIQFAAPSNLADLLDRFSSVCSEIERVFSVPYTRHPVSSGTLVSRGSSLLTGLPTSVSPGDTLTYRLIDSRVLGYGLFGAALDHPHRSCLLRAMATDVSLKLASGQLNLSNQLLSGYVPKIGDQVLARCEGFWRRGRVAYSHDSGFSSANSGLTYWGVQLTDMARIEKVASNDIIDVSSTPNGYGRFPDIPQLAILACLVEPCEKSPFEDRAWLARWLADRGVDLPNCGGATAVKQDDFDDAAKGPPVRIRIVRQIEFRQKLAHLVQLWPCGTDESDKDKIQACSIDFANELERQKEAQAAASQSVCRDIRLGTDPTVSCSRAMFNAPADNQADNDDAPPSTGGSCPPATAAVPQQQSADQFPPSAPTVENWGKCSSTEPEVQQQQPIVVQEPTRRCINRPTVIKALCNQQQMYYNDYRYSNKDRQPKDFSNAELASGVQGQSRRLPLHQQQSSHASVNQPGEVDNPKPTDRTDGEGGPDEPAAAAAATPEVEHHAGFDGSDGVRRRNNNSGRADADAGETGAEVNADSSRRRQQRNGGGKSKSRNKKDGTGYRGTVRRK
uniref:SET domain-containing protein n=1 Tax=Macrostomum lignano TaxID=282301 RepID=A0A1I8HAP8_9PLAT